MWRLMSDSRRPAGFCSRRSGAGSSVASAARGRHRTAGEETLLEDLYHLLKYNFEESDTRAEPLELQ